MAVFQDRIGENWILAMTVGGVELVRNCVTTSDGKPVDILAIIDKGNFGALKKDVRALIDTVFIFCREQALERFDEARFDQEHELEYSISSHIRNFSRSQKMQYWFASRIDGATLERMTDAFIEALLDFTPGQTRKKALALIYEKEEMLARANAEEVCVQAEILAEETRASLQKQIKEAARQEAKRLRELG
ncbi:MAG: hypothetical protein Q4D38_13950 [Planctomycetia bacterium]|nr:hypothetical protein [Planctomycetia bacterium]